MYDDSVFVALIVGIVAYFRVKRIVGIVALALFCILTEEFVVL